MAKQLNIDLNFRANTTQAQQQIQQLQTSLTQIAAAGTVGIGGEKITAEMKQASAAAKELQMHLSKAMNTQTGTLDLNRLNNSLTGAKTNLQTLSSSLLQIGPAGTTAFTQLATAVSQADRPMLALNGKLTQLWTVMKNTAKWQLSSSMIHGFIGGISQAYRYAQDLNESLNNIRIVTGYSADYMENFAVQANKAAKALSTTTNEYAKASLIYFQQGLSDQQVKDRTDITIKMANVSRQSAEVVSDQMTAVWNNFYDGSKSLEYYADVMTALGAKTASSSDEIAGGLEKFAAIGDTIGLSYEYAASALATITANTRQSEEVVGTALKTIFARIQGLKLGETLEDGVELNKYSEALATIGVDIFDANKNLKDMDIILDETAEKWDTLTKAQQTATAQTVAGIRQYNQFIALMDNWNDGTSDSMVANLETSYGATGALDEQADIYAESWEAARDRVTASAEAIYNALLDDDFFIGLANMFSGLLDSVNGFIDEIGGLKTIMIGAFGLLASYLGNKIQPMINNLRANFQVLFTGASQQAINLGNSMRQAISSAQSNTGINVGIAERQQLQNANDLIIAKNKLSSVNKNLNSEERFLAETELQLIQMEQERAASLALSKEKSIEKTNQLKEELMAEESLLKLQQSSTNNIDKRYQGFQRDFSNAVLEGDDDAMMAASGQLDMIEQHYTGVKEAASSTANTIRNEFIASLEQTNYTVPTTSQLFQAQINELGQLKTQLSDGAFSYQEAKTGIEMYAQTLPKVIMEQKEVQESYRRMMTETSNPKELVKGLETFIQSLENAKVSAKDLEKIMRQFGQGGIADKIKASFKEQKKVTDDLSASQERLKQAFANFQPAHNFTGIERMTAMASALSSVAMAAMSVKTIFSSWANEDMSFGEKLTSSLMGLGMLWPSLTGMATSFGKALGFANIQQAMQVTKTLEQVTASQILTAQLTAEQLAQKTGISLDQAEVIMSRIQAQAMMEEAAKRGVLGGARMKEVLAEKLGITAKQASTIMSEMKAGASWKEALATAGVTGGLNLNTKAIWANVAATWAWLWPILAVVAAIGLIVAAVKLSINAYNADAIAAKKAAQTAEELSAAYDECASAYQEMIDTMSKYEEARKSLDQLVEGTDEYKAALQEANRAALELIQNNPGKFQAGKDYQWQGDQLVISDDAMKHAKEEGQKQVNTMYAAKQIGQAKADQAQAKADVTNTARSMHGYDGEYDTDGMINSQITKLVEQGVKIYTEDQNLFANKDYMAEQLNIDPNGAYAEALWKNREALIEVGNETKAAADSYSIATEVAVRELLQNNDKVENSENKKEIIEASVQEYQDNYQAELDKLEEEGWGTSGISKASGAGNQTAQNIFAEYAKAAGLEDVDLTDVTGTDSARAFKYVDSEGEEKTVTLNTMREVMAAAKANESTNEIATNLAEMVDNFDKWIDDLNTGKIKGKNGMTAGAAEETKNFVLKKDFSQASSRDLQDIRKQIGNNGENTESYLGSLFGGSDGKLDDAEAQKYGYDTAKEFIDAFNKGIEDAEKNWESLKIPEGLNQPTDVGYEAAQNMSSTYNNIVEGDSMSDFENMFGGEDGFISDEEAKALGAESAAALRTGFQEAIANGEESATSYLDNLVGQLPEGDAREKGVILAQNLKNGISEGFAQGQQFTENINAILDTIAAEDKTVAYEALANIDWSKWDASKTAIEALGELGISSEKTDEKIKELEASMRSVTGAVKDFGQVNNSLDTDIDSKEYESLAKHLKSVAKESKDLSKDLAYNEKAAKKVSEAILRFDNAIQDVNDNYEDWAHTLKSGSLQDQAKVAEQLGDAYADMLDIDVGSLSNDFIMNANNLELMKQAANGSEEAYKQLQAAAAEDILMQCGVTMDDTEFWNKKAALDAQLAGLNFQDLEIGASLNDAQALQAMTDLVNAAGMTAQQATDYLASMGVDAEVETVETEEPVERTVNNLTPTVTYQDASIPVVAGDGAVENQTVKVPQIMYKAEGQTITDTVAGGGVALKVTSATKSSGGNFKFKNSSHGGGVNGPKNSGGGGGGGGGGANKPKKPTKAKTVEKTDPKEKDDEIERYKEITEKLDDLNNELDKIGKLKDDAWGPDKLAAMDDELDKLNDIIDAQETYINQIGQIDKDGKALGGKLLEDRNAVEALGGIFDENGRLTNYEELMGGLVDTWNSTQAALDDREQAYENSVADVANTEYAEGQEAQQWAAEDANDAEKEAIDQAREDADKVYEDGKRALEQYTETLNLSEEAQLQLNDYLRQMRELNYEQLEYKLEIRIELNENDIADIEHQLERLGDNNVYASAERIAVIQKNTVSYRNIADAQMEAIKEAERLYAAREISQEDYMARLQESKEALQDTEMSIRDGIAQIGDELENTFELVDEKLDQQFTKFDQLIELMEHYKNVVSLTEGEASYKEFNEILRASQEVLRDRIEADKSEVAMWESRRKQLEADIATLPEDSPAKREAEEALQAIMEKEADAKSQLMSDIEQLGEYAREIFENSIEQAMKDFEDEMFGRPLNSIIESIEMMNSRQEELLTTTNKIYETNKLIRNVEKDIEATTNKRAKQAFAEFQNKVKQKQEQNELTKFELDLLTAEYEMTKAQIALEEAQNAKDTVRLTRDAEGNYGYVYTANEDKVSDAEQALDDATNNYYNTALEGAQKYQDQIYQHIQEWEEKVKEIYLDQTLSEEEKNKKIKEINDTYNTLITQDKNLYYMAVGAMQESAYNTQVDYDLKGIESAENWFDECDGFLSDLEDAQDEYDSNTGEVSKHTEENFGKMSNAIRNTKQESEYLKDQIVDELVPELDTTLKDSIDNATLAWQKYIEALEEVIRLTDEAMKKNHDTQLTEAYKGDYAAEIQERLANGADYDDYDIQQLLQARWDKMGGMDNTDYQALINAGGTPEQIALWEVLRRFKIDKTDWSTVDGDWAKDIRATKMDQDFAQLIINYFKSSSHARWSDETVQGYLAARQAKIDEGHESAKGAISNEELKNYVAQLLNKKPEQLKTGGYTGSWGPEGKLAVLHEKELVLNAEDTKNFLSATGILREISQMLDRDALIASLGAINLRAMTLNTPADQVLQQEVTIHADFPNVTDHNEIELAIDNLINAASQHAYRT